MGPTTGSAIGFGFMRNHISNDFPKLRKASSGFDSFDLKGDLANAYFVRVTTLPALIQDDRSCRLEIVEEMFNDEIASWNRHAPVWLTVAGDSSVAIDVDDVADCGTVNVIDSVDDNTTGYLKNTAIGGSTSVAIDTMASVDVLPVSVHSECTNDTLFPFIKEAVVDVSDVQTVTSNLATLCGCHDFMRCDHCNIFSKPRRLNGLVFGTMSDVSDTVFDEMTDVIMEDDVSVVSPTTGLFDRKTGVCSSYDVGLTTSRFDKAGSILFGSIAVPLSDATLGSVVSGSDQPGDGSVDTAVIGVSSIEEVYIGGVSLALVGCDSQSTSVFTIRDEPRNIIQASSYNIGDELCCGPRCASGWYQYIITNPDDEDEVLPETVVPPPPADLSDAIVSNGVRCLLVPEKPLLGLLFRPVERVLNVAMSMYSYYTASVTEFLDRLEGYVGSEFVCYGYDALYDRFPVGSWSECDFCDRRFNISCRLTDRFDLTGFVGRGCNCCDGCLRQTSVRFERHAELAPCILVHEMLAALQDVAKKHHKKFRKPDEFIYDVSCHTTHEFVAFLDNAWLRLAESGRCRALGELCKRHVLFIDSGSVEWMDRNAAAFAEGAYQTLVRARRT